MGLLAKPMRKMPSARITLQGMPIHSRFVLERLKKTPYDQRQLVLDLLQIEQRVLDRNEGLPDAAGRDALMQKYPEDTRAIEAELLSPAHFELRKRRRDPAEKHQDEARRLKESERPRTDEEARKEWAILGGRP